MCVPETIQWFFDSRNEREREREVDERKNDLARLRVREILIESFFPSFSTISMREKTGFEKYRQSCAKRRAINTCRISFFFCFFLFSIIIIFYLFFWNCEREIFNNEWRGKERKGKSQIHEKYKRDPDPQIFTMYT